MLLTKSLVVLCSVAAVMAQNAANAVVSGAIFIGEDTTVPPATPYSIFKKTENHITGVSSVLVFAAKGANFFPAQKPPKTLVPTLDAFIEKATSFPAFGIASSLEQDIYLNGSFSQFEKEIRDADKDTTDLALIARSFRDLIPGQVKDKSLTDWILHLVVIKNDKDLEQVKFKLARVTLSLKSDQQDTVIIPKQKAKLAITEYDVFGSALVQNAESLQKIIKEVNSPRNAVDFFTSPKILDNGLNDWVNVAEESNPLVEWYRQQVVLQL